MPAPNDNLGIREKVSIVLTGPDGKVKDKREIKSKPEVKDVSGKRPGT